MYGPAKWEREDRERQLAMDEMEGGMGVEGPQMRDVESSEKEVVAPVTLREEEEWEEEEEEEDVQIQVIERRQALLEERAVQLVLGEEEGRKRGKEEEDGVLASQ